jgi:hypothetical protein
MAAISVPILPRTTDRDRGKYLTATEIIGDIECQILLEQDSTGQFHEVDLIPVGPPPEEEPS